MNKQGHGLGLSICNTIVQELKGRLKVDSELGKGTKFTFAFKTSFCQSENDIKRVFKQRVNRLKQDQQRIKTTKVLNLQMIQEVDDEEGQQNSDQQGLVDETPNLIEDHTNSDESSNDSFEELDLSDVSKNIFMNNSSSATSSNMTAQLKAS